ncbi:MAG: (E)-4-hydroxy-3-methylbut-2-enyl-diphosphate synthase [Bacteroidales bacterium]|jgi:(E)-4-hydroxy-3-methylbut-2-enyl-diphosphate synthase|nr:(E)-4-hydroxy-3-methylbut-2-enyl-diphosphate synthase [Bacteroidales bacterium]MCI2121158.1 (E)-4-hydroxy-3-methylbut-2-enyl-diphosphate synthase [Bacteroidales bacterium]MCI2144747.1 (E)-4-hydroxy-3-methylbut-2-enyl-diphosphate synthase [Bacteroidales bacterium]
MKADTGIERISFDIGGVKFGDGAPVVLQTMCNTSTDDIEASVNQCKRCFDAGAKLVRLTTQGKREVSSLSEIKKRLHADGYYGPLAADVHFSAETAIAAASVADKVRINPGNFSFSRDESGKASKVASEAFNRLIGTCRDTGCALRIGINHGSLGERITARYGDSPRGMAEAATEWMDKCIESDFRKVVFSLKSSNPIVMVEAYRLFMKKMESRGLIFPLHIGVTEAGNGDTGRIKSAVGIYSLLREGIGDTVRVSLTEPPENEIPVARMITFHDPKASYDFDTWEEFIVAASCDFGPALVSKRISDFDIKATVGGKMVTAEKMSSFKEDLLQACRLKFTKPEYIACPGCGRTLYDIGETLDKIKEATKDLGGVRIAVMGCIVNGPGEMADADYGYVGAGRGLVTLYSHGKVVEKNIPERDAVLRLKALISRENSTFATNNG